VEDFHKRKNPKPQFWRFWALFDFGMVRAFLFGMKKTLSVFLLGLHIMLLSILAYGKVSTKFWEHCPEAESQFYALELEHRLYVP
jgi:uncharacterized membrane protein